MILFVSTEYFEKLLTIPMKERDMHEIPMMEISGATLRTIVEYFYTGQIKMTAENGNDLVAAATMYRFVKLREKCAAFYDQNMDAENCLSVCAIADQYNFENLNARADDFLHTQFMDVMKHNEFLQLKGDELLKLVKSENILVHSETDILDGISKWIQFDVDGRKDLYKDLIMNVNLLKLGQMVSEIEFAIFNILR